MITTFLAALLRPVLRICKLSNRVVRTYVFALWLDQDKRKEKMKTRTLRSMRSALTVAALGLIAGCATPDFKPFAAETAALGGAIAAEQAEVIAHFAQTGAKAETRNPDDTRVKRLGSQKDTYAQNAEAVNALMTVAVNYSSTLVDLAAAGETGAKAVTSLTDTLKGFSSALSIALPVAAIPVWASALVKEIAQDVTRIQAQNTLAEATKSADPTITKIAKAIADLYQWPSGGQVLTAVGLQTSEEGVLQDTVGRNRIAFYRGINVKEVKVGDRQSQTRLEYFFGDTDDRIAKQSPAAGICGIAAWEPARDAKGQFIKDKSGNPVFAAQQGNPRDDPNCLTGQTVQSLQAIVSLLSAIEPQFQAYTRDLAASRKWLEQRKASSRQISEAAKMWATEHSTLAKQLEQCGGLRAIRSSCGNLSFSNFKLAVDRVKTIAGKGDNDAK